MEFLLNSLTNPLKSVAKNISKAAFSNNQQCRLSPCKGNSNIPNKSWGTWDRWRSPTRAYLDGANSLSRTTVESIWLKGEWLEWDNLIICKKVRWYRKNRRDNSRREHVPPRLASKKVSVIPLFKKPKFDRSLMNLYANGFEDDTVVNLFDKIEKEKMQKRIDLLTEENNLLHKNYNKLKN